MVMDPGGLRWFTPRVEVHLCGHGTLAAAHVLWEDKYEPPETPIRFRTLAGELTAFRRPGGAGELDFPAESLDVLEPPAGLLRTIGGQIRRLGRGHTFVVAEICGGRSLEDRPSPRGPTRRPVVQAGSAASVAATL
jgi:predicted PhzF superfamily epimerase YddE/YHI9